MTIDIPPSPSPPAGVGSRMVSDALGITPRRLDTLHEPEGIEDILAQLVVCAARDLDHLHEQFIARSEAAADTLTRITTGKTTAINALGVLQHSATHIDILAARRADAIEHLRQVLRAYRHVATLAPTAPHHAPARTPNPTPGATSAKAGAPRRR